MEYQKWPVLILRSSVLNLQNIFNASRRLM